MLAVLGFIAINFKVYTVKQLAKAAIPFSHIDSYFMMKMVAMANGCKKWLSGIKQ